MDKFLNIVEQSLPQDDIEVKIEAKRALQRYLMGKDIKVQAKVFKDEVFITLNDGRVVQLEVKGITKPKQEEAEDMTSPGVVSAITAVAGLPDQPLGKQLTSSTARKLQIAKRNMASAAEKISKKFLDATSKMQ